MTITTTTNAINTYYTAHTGRSSEADLKKINLFCYVVRSAVTKSIVVFYPTYGYLTFIRIGNRFSMYLNIHTAQAVMIAKF